MRVMRLVLLLFNLSEYCLMWICFLNCYWLTYVDICDAVEKALSTVTLFGNGYIGYDLEDAWSSVLCNSDYYSFWFKTNQTDALLLYTGELTGATICSNCKLVLSVSKASVSLIMCSMIFCWNNIFEVRCCPDVILNKSQSVHWSIANVSGSCWCFANCETGFF